MNDREYFESALAIKINVVRTDAELLDAALEARKNAHAPYAANACRSCGTKLAVRKRLFSAIARTGRLCSLGSMPFGSSPKSRAVKFAILQEVERKGAHVRSNRLHGIEQRNRGCADRHAGRRVSDRVVGQVVGQCTETRYRYGGYDGYEHDENSLFLRLSSNLSTKRRSLVASLTRKRS
jgi:hypothetical protein